MSMCIIQVRFFLLYLGAHVDGILLLKTCSIQDSYCAPSLCFSFRGDKFEALLSDQLSYEHPNGGDCVEKQYFIAENLLYPMVWLCFLSMLDFLWEWIGGFTFGSVVLWAHLWWWLCWKTVFYSWKLALSNGVIVLLVYVGFSVGMNRRLYFRISCLMSTPMVVTMLKNSIL